MWHGVRFGVCSRKFSWNFVLFLCINFQCTKLLFFVFFCCCRCCSLGRRSTFFFLFRRWFDTDKPYRRVWRLLHYIKWQNSVQKLTNTQQRGNIFNIICFVCLFVSGTGSSCVEFTWCVADNSKIGLFCLFFWKRYQIKMYFILLINFKFEHLAKYWRFRLL